MIQTNWYVITGGPSSGKTSVINFLASRGYFTIHESARPLIEKEKRKGKTLEEIVPTKEFQERAHVIREILESRVPPFLRTFFDRGIGDSLAYCKFYGFNPDQIIEDAQKRRYKGVFFLEQLPTIEDDGVRIEDPELASHLSKLIYDSYQDLDYEIIRTPAISPVKKRAEFILEKAGKRIFG